MDLLTTYAHSSALQAITELSLIPTIYKSLQYALSILQPAVSSSAVTWQRLLTVVIIELYALKFHPHSLPYRTA
jgi:hypothetical protein